VGRQGQPNAQQALRAMYQWLGGSKEIRGGQFEKADVEATDALFHGKVKQGLKRNNFYLNLLSIIKPEKLDPEFLRQAGVTKTDPGWAVTIDLWMQRLLGQRSDAPPTSVNVAGENSSPQYDFGAKLARVVAARKHWKPMQAQASMWAFIKARSKFESKLAMRKAGMPLPKWAELKKEMAYDFADAVAEMRGEIALETAPGMREGYLPGYHYATPAQQFEYHVAQIAKYYNGNGENIVLKALDIPGPPAYNAIGSFEGQNNPVTKFGVYAPMAQQTTGGKPIPENTGKLEPAAHKLISGVSAFMGLLEHQDAGGWVRPFYDTSLGKSNGVQLNYGKILSAREMTALETALNAVMGSDQYAAVAYDNGVWILNISEYSNAGKIDSAVFKKYIVTAGKKTPGVVEVRHFSSDGDYATAESDKGGLHAIYRQRMREAGRPDVFKRLEILLRAKGAKIAADFARRYGWDEQPTGRELPGGVPGAEAAGAVETPITRYQVVKKPRVVPPTSSPDEWMSIMRPPSINREDRGDLR
jgi:hypothetical protein